MMVRLGAFARSDQGRLYATVCQHYGLDPGAPFSDDVVAFNLRAALMVATPPQDIQPDTEDEDASWAAAGEANMRAWAGGG